MTIDERLDRIEKKLDTLLSQLRGGASATGAAVSARASGNGASPAAGEVATDADLDGSRGNPEVRFSPRRWNGQDFKGRRYSECDPDFLDMLAEALEYFATRDDEANALDKNGNPKSKWSRLDAARTRGWARRLRNGGGRVATAPVATNGRASHAAPPPVTDDFATGRFGGDDEIPF